VFALLPKLLERSGTAPNGTITALYTVLVDGDDMNEPIADAVRSILDGHIVLSRRLAHAGHYPAVDVLASVSRLVGEVTSRDVRSAGDDVRRLMAAFKEKEDLIAIGAYQAGADPLTDAAIAARHPIEGFLRQRVDDFSSAEDADRALLELSAFAELVRAPDPLAAAVGQGIPAEGGTPLHAAIPPARRAVAATSGRPAARALPRPRRATPGPG
jgi:flagellum-specific ATP synthase